MTQLNHDVPILEMRGITKRFPGLIALNGVDFAARRGEIHALIGQNGAGKSTLMKVLAGVYPLDEGELRIEGEVVRFTHPRDALRMGIGTVYQDLSLVPRLSVADNIFLGREAGNGEDRRGSALVVHDADVGERDVARVTHRAAVGQRVARRRWAGRATRSASLSCPPIHSFLLCAERRCGGTGRSPCPW